MIENNNFNQGNNDAFGDLPTNYEEYVKFMEIMEWPGKLTSETILPLRDELVEYQDINLIRGDLEANIGINMDQLDKLEERLVDHGNYIMKYSDFIFDVPYLLSRNIRQGTEIINDEFEYLGAKMRQMSKQVASRLVAASEDKAVNNSIMELNLKSVEFYQYGGYKDVYFNELPCTTDALRMMHLAVKNCKFPKHFRKTWWKIFACEASVGIVHDLFWWCFIDNYKIEDNSENKEKLFCRVALNFGILLMSLSDDVANKFLPLYPHVLSMTLYCIFYQAFPASRKLFGPDFKQRLVNTCYVWVTGLQPLPNSFNNWPIEKLQMITDESAESKDRDVSKAKLPKLNMQGKESGFTYCKVLFDPKGCSPLINAFLQMHNIDPSRSVLSKCVDRIELVPATDHLLTHKDYLQDYKIRKEERQSRYNQACVDNDKQIQIISRRRLELEKRFDHLQRNIDDCSNVLDMRNLLQEYLNS